MRMEIGAARPWAAGAFVGLAAAAGSAHAVAQARLEPVWSYANANWIPDAVSIGEEGSQVFGSLGTLDNAAYLFSSSDTHPPAPVWSNANSSIALRTFSDSAARTDVHVRLTYQTTDVLQPNWAVLERYSSSDVEPDWSYTFPFQVQQPPGGVAVSRDGQTIVAWVWDAAHTDTVFAVFSTSSPTPASYTSLHTYGNPVGVELSADGSTLYICSGIRTFLIDVASASVIDEFSNWTTATTAHAMSADGKRFAQGLIGGQVRVYELQGDAYAELLTHAGGGNSWCQHVALSGDGRTLAAAFDDLDSFLDSRVRVIDLAHPAMPVVLDHVVHGAGTRDNLASDLALSHDGRTLVAGFWGDEAGLAKEVHLFRRVQGAWSEHLDFDLAGSVRRVDVSHDGMRFVVGSKAVHNEVLAGGGRIDLFEVGAEDLVLRGVPSIGGTVVVEHELAPGMLSRSIYAGALNQPPLPFPGVGTLYLDRQDLHLFASDTADGEGIARTSYSIPDDPSLVGSTVYFQALQASPRRLSQDWIKMTILP